MLSPTKLDVETTDPANAGVHNL